ncbi:hypothetical protein BDM02DRAFT_3268263, partial [Thelephora ganbajun]
MSPTLYFSEEIKVGAICMLYHAARVSKRTLLTRISSPESGNIWPCSAFTTALQVAAARAWTRTAARNLRNVLTSASVTLEEGNTIRTKEPLPGAPSDSNPRGWLNGRQSSSFATRDSSSAWIEDDPLVDSGESSFKATQPPTYPTTPIRPTSHSLPSEPYAHQIDRQDIHSLVHDSHISPGTTENRSRTPIRKPRRHLPYSRDLAGLPEPITPLDLLNNLDKWRKRPPKSTVTPLRTGSSSSTRKPPMLNFEALHTYHARFPALQTHRSFRALAEIAINEAKFKAVRRLWIEMDRKGMLSDWDSLDDGGVSLWAVWVRWMVRQGKWVEAWKTAQRWRAKMAKLSALKLASEGLPHAIWIEFLGKAHGSVDRLSSSGSGSRRRNCVTGEEPSNARGLVEGGELGLGEHHKLLTRQSPHRNHSQITNVRPRTIYALVRARLRLGDREWSMNVIRKWFERMGSEKAKTDTKGNRACLRLLHLYLALAFPLPNGKQTAGSGIPKGFSSVREMETVVNGLMELNPRVKPNSTTVLLLLRHLRPTAKCADNGVRLVTRYKRLYGDDVDDERVRLRLASFAIKQNNPK